MSKRNDYLNIATIINKAINETENLQCTCNKYLESKCDRCCLIESLTRQMNDIVCLATRPIDEY